MSSFKEKKDQSAVEKGPWNAEASVIGKLQSRRAGRGALFGEVIQASVLLTFCSAFVKRIITGILMRRAEAACRFKPTGGREK